MQTGCGEGMPDDKKRVAFVRHTLYMDASRLPRRLCALVDRKAAVLYPALLQVEPAGLDGIR